MDDLLYKQLKNRFQKNLTVFKIKFQKYFSKSRDSVYYKMESCTYRISNHLPSKDQVILGGTLININSFDKLDNVLNELTSEKFKQGVYIKKD